MKPCPRCHGQMFLEDHPFFWPEWNCINCGNTIDPRAPKEPLQIPYNGERAFPQYMGGLAARQPVWSE